MKNTLDTLYRLPYRAWKYGQKRPHEAIVYGSFLGLFALASKFVLVSIAVLTVVSGVKKAIDNPEPI
jgi:uncharacterized metal-binding protein